MKHSSLVIAPFVALLLHGTAHGQQWIGGGNEGSDPGVQKVLRDVQAITSVPALGGALITPFSIRSAVFGRRRADSDESVEPGDFFQLGSCTKSMTAVLAGVLVERKLIRWDTTVSQAFPDFAPKIHPQLRNVTLTQLLTHRSGLRSLSGGVEFLFSGIYSGAASRQRRDFAREILSEPPSFPVGSFNYSNAGYGIAAAMLEEASSRPWEQMLQYDLFAQFGGRVRLWWPGQNDPGQPWGHVEYQDQLIPLDPEVQYEHQEALRIFTDIAEGTLQPTQENISGLYNVLSLNRTTAPAGAATSTIRDFARYTQMHLIGALGGKTIVSAQTMKRLHTSVGGPAFGTAGYAYGWIPLKVDGVDTWFHDGSADPFYALMVFQPSRRLAAVAFSNTGQTKGEVSAFEIVGRLLGIKDLQRKVDGQLVSGN